MKTLPEIQQLHRDGQLAEAKAAYLAFLHAHPDDAVALHWLSLLYAEEMQWQAAETYLQKAIRLAPDHPALVLHLANILKENGEIDRAIQILTDLISRYPHYAAAYNNLGGLYFSKQQWEAAAHAYQHAIDEQADYIDAYYNLGLALNKLNRRQAACQAFHALVALSPQHAAGRFQWGCLLMQLADYQAAIEQFLQIEKIHPFHLETQANLATSFLRCGQLLEAKVHYLKALEIAPNDEQILFNLGVISTQQSKIRDAVDFYLSLLKINPDIFEAHNNVGIAYLFLKNVDNALIHFREALRLQPDNVAIQHSVQILMRDESLSTSPRGYIQALFDSYADYYDAHLVNILHYDVPQILFELVKKTSGVAYQTWRIVDLGCGTGLSGQLFKTAHNVLIGVDLSEKMLALAKQKNIYNALACEDITLWLIDKYEQYDLMIAGDTLVYMGDLAELFSAVYAALVTKGLFVFNLEEIEREEQRDYQMTISGRFAHSHAYIERLAKDTGFKVLQYHVAQIRTQDHLPIQGHFYVLEKYALSPASGVVE
ncbi:MAG TPA: tetratricopeptide repeat protein [Gammaproteobacteria bacterium]|nr:tetratricopeptide repeat protein [Gammaproteobacteria bacterium]